MLLASVVSSTFLQLSGYRQMKRLRVELFRSILRQDVTWYDVHQTTELNTRLNE